MHWGLPWVMQCHNLMIVETCDTKLRTTTHCNTLWHTATYCNTLQRTVCVWRCLLNQYCGIVTVHGFLSERSKARYKTTTENRRRASSPCPPLENLGWLDSRPLPSSLVTTSLAIPIPGPVRSLPTRFLCEGKILSASLVRALNNCRISWLLGSQGLQNPAPPRQKIEQNPGRGKTWPQEVEY